MKLVNVKKKLGLFLVATIFSTTCFGQINTLSTVTGENATAIVAALGPVSLADLALKNKLGAKCRAAMPIGAAYIFKFRYYDGTNWRDSYYGRSTSIYAKPFLKADYITHKKDTTKNWYATIIDNIFNVNAHAAAGPGPVAVQIVLPATLPVYTIPTYTKEQIASAKLAMGNFIKSKISNCTGVTFTKFSEKLKDVTADSVKFVVDPSAVNKKQTLCYSENYSIPVRDNATCAMKNVIIQLPPKLCDLFLRKLRKGVESKTSSTTGPSTISSVISTSVEFLQITPEIKKDFALAEAVKAEPDLAINTFAVEDYDLSQYILDTDQKVATFEKYTANMTIKFADLTLAEKNDMAALYLTNKMAEANVNSNKQLSGIIKSKFSDSVEKGVIEAYIATLADNAISVVGVPQTFAIDTHVAQQLSPISTAIGRPAWTKLNCIQEFMMPVEKAQFLE